MTPYHDDHRRPPMRPEEVAHHQFTLTSRLGGRGYDQDEVRDYLLMLGEELHLRDEEVAILRRENRRLKDWYRQRGEDPASRHQREVTTEAIAIVARAQEQAERELGAARAQAAAEINDAQAQASLMLAEAREDADRAAANYRRSAGPSYQASEETRLRLHAMLNVIMRNVMSMGDNAQAIAEVIKHDMNLLTEPGQPTPARGHAWQ
jgi:DivIVA domain-containing protein